MWKANDLRFLLFTKKNPFASAARKKVESKPPSAMAPVGKKDPTLT